jgi:hypothetical protein
MSTSGPPWLGSTPGQGRAERPSVAWGESLDFEVIGRDDELARVQALLDDARSRVTGSLVVEGEPGIGKSTLLQAVQQRATGFRCVRVRGVESERVLAHAGLLQALGSLRDRLAEVPEAQREALSAALGWGPAASPPRPSTTPSSCWSTTCNGSTASRRLP